MNRYDGLENWFTDSGKQDARNALSSELLDHFTDDLSFKSTESQRVNRQSLDQSKPQTDNSLHSESSLWQCALPGFELEQARANKREKADSADDAPAKKDTDKVQELARTLDQQSVQQQFSKGIADARKAIEHVKPSDRPGSKQEVALLTFEWQLRVMELINRSPYMFGEYRRSTEPVDLQKTLKKIAENKFETLSSAELKAAIQLEGVGGEFGPASQYAYSRTMRWFNHAVLHTYKDLISTGLRLHPGGPIPSFTGDAETSTGFGSSPETFKSKLLSENTDVAEIKRLTDSGKISSELLFETKSKPGREELRKFDNTIFWFEESHARLAEQTLRLEANNRHRVIEEVLKIKDNGWRPPADSRELAGYNQRADEVCNLMLRVRNYAEAIKSLEKIDGDFKTKAFETFPGDIDWDQKDKRICKMTLDLPETLMVTVDSEKKLQKLRDWLDKFGPEIERATDEYRKGNFIRYGDFLEKGRVAVDKDGHTVQVWDEAGRTRVVRNEEGKLITRTLDGQLVDGKKVLPAEHKTAAAKSEQYDYICDKFSVSRNDKNEIVVNTYRSIEKDHLLNYNRWVGSQVGSYEEKKTYKPEDLVAVETSSGKVQLIRADRLEEFKAIQAFFHHGPKVASCAMDIGMVVSGSIGARAALQAGRFAYAGINAGRAMLGVTGLMDPTFRQMGETGDRIRQLRHGLILIDVTQGLLRQGLGAATTGKMLFESEGAAAVHKVIENSKWMSRAESATAKVFGGCDAIYLPVLGVELYEKVKMHIGDNPHSLLDAAVDQIGNGRGTEQKLPGRKGVDAESISALMDTYFKLLDIQEERDKLAVSKRLTEIKNALTDEAKSKATRETLAGLWCPSVEQMLEIKKRNHDSLPRTLTDRQITGTEEEKISAALGLIFLSRDKDGNLPQDGVLIRSDETIPGYKYIKGHGKAKQHVSVEPENIVRQVTVQDVVHTLRTAAFCGEKPPTRLVAADSLFRLGAIGSGKYASLILDILEREPSDTQNKELRIMSLKQLSDLIDFGRLLEANPAVAANSRLRLAGENYGASSTVLTDRLLAISKTEKDPDLRAMAIALSHAHNHELPAEALAPYFKRYEQLKNSSGKFRQTILDELTSDLGAKIPDNPKKEREAAIEKRLRAAQALQLFQSNPSDAAAVKQLDIHKSLIDCLTACGGRNICNYKEGESINLKLAIKVLDAVMSSGKVPTESQREDIARTALGIMEIPYVKEGSDRFAPAVAKLAIIGRMERIFETSKLRQDMAGALKNILQLDNREQGIRSGWGMLPELRVAAIEGLTSLGSADAQSLQLISERLLYNAKEKGTDSFGEQVPQVRASAVRALSLLAENRMRFSEANIKEIEKKEPKIRETLGLNGALYVGELLKRERDPVVLDLLWRVWERRNRIEPESTEYKRAYDLEVEKLQSAAQITFSRDQALAFVRSRPELKNLDSQFLEGEVRRRTEELRVDPYAGFFGWCDSCVSSRSTIRKRNEEATTNARLDASREKRREKEESLEALIHFDKLDSSEQAKAIKTLMHIVRCPDQALFSGGDTQMARIRASEMLLRLTRGDDARDRVAHKELLSRTIVSCLLDSSIDTNAQVKLNLFKCVDNLTANVHGSTNQKDDIWIITPERASLIYWQVVDRETRQKFDTTDNPLEKERSGALMMHALHRLYQLRSTGSAYRLDALANNEEFKKSQPEVSTFAKKIHQSLQHGVGHLQRDATPSRWDSLSDRADFMEANLPDATFNYEEACRAFFRACKDKPIEYPTDPRATVLMDALSHQNERVRLTAALILSDSKIGTHMIRAVEVLAGLAVNGSREQYRSDAAKVLNDIILQGQPVEQDFAFGQWKKLFDAHCAEQKSSRTPGPIPPTAIPDSKAVSLRRMEADEWARLHGLSADSTKTSATDLHRKRIAHIAAVTGRKKSDIESELEVERYKLNLRLGGGPDTRQCHQPNKGPTLMPLKNPPPLLFLRPSQHADSAKGEDPSKTLEWLTKGLREKEERAIQEERDEKAAAQKEREARRQRLEEMETRYNILPFVIQNFEKQPHPQKTEWGQVRNKDAFQLDDRLLAARNQLTSAEILETRLKQASSPAEKIAAMKVCCDRTPIAGSTDKRIQKIIGLLTSDDASVQRQAAETILRTRENQLFHPGFSDQHRERALEALRSVQRSRK